MSSSHNFHIRNEQPIVTFFDADALGALRISDDHGLDITVFYWDVQKDRLQRAIAAFNEIMREPVAQQIAAE